MEDVLAFKSTFHGLVAGWKGMCPQGIELLVYEFSSSILVSILDSIPLSNFFCQTRLHTMVASSVYWVWEQLQELAESSLVFLSLNVSARFDQTRKVFHEFAYHLKSMRIRALFNWNAKSQARSNVHRLHASVASRDAEAEAVSWASRFHISGIATIIKWLHFCGSGSGRAEAEAVEAEAAEAALKSTASASLVARLYRDRKRAVSLELETTSKTER